MKDLPEKFQFRCKGGRFSGYTHVAKRNAQGDYEIQWARGWHKKVDQIDWTAATCREVLDFVGGGGWIIVDDKPALTTEQQKQLKEFKEQVDALNSNIKLNEQDIEHKNRLIANYRERVSELNQKILEMQ